MSRTIGLDLGSRRTKLVLMENESVLEKQVFRSWALDHESIAAFVHARKPDLIGATGYYRHLAGPRLSGPLFSARIATEIKAFARGAGFLAPQARTLIDIGGQDAKIIHLGEHGIALDFDMNDKCAAGTGKFFEILANTLGMSLDEMIQAADQAEKAVSISSTCAVFAESEVIGRLAEGAQSAELARGAFKSVAERLAAMASRVSAEPPVILVGGGANRVLAKELEAMLSVEVSLPEHGVYFGAIGIALLSLSEFLNRGLP